GIVAFISNQRSNRARDSDWSGRYLRPRGESFLALLCYFPRNGCTSICIKANPDPKAARFTTSPSVGENSLQSALFPDSPQSAGEKALFLAPGSKHVMDTEAAKLLPTPNLAHILREQDLNISHKL